MKNFENAFNKNRYEGGGLENILQIELANEIYDCESHEAMNKWVEKDSEAFRDLIEDHPDYVNEYKESLGDEGDKEVVLKKIKKKLLEKEDKIAEA